ncbi:hypothetical protein ACH5RR_017513 [Cinchona calisaya]|uniref:Zinc finger GRF-type domain-containing protein n=1 Tax=Cinchona calisaya TaxID=153742 RepID=A0ABD2ZMK1_9GENT
MVTSWTDDNLGKRFFCCDRLQGSVGRDFFQWHDPVMCRRSRALIPGLLRGMTAKDAESERLRIRERRLIYLVLTVFSLILLRWLS